MRKRKLVDLSGLGGRGNLGGIEGGKTIIRIYCMKKILLFLIIIIIKELGSGGAGF